MFGVLHGIIGTIQVNEVINIISDQGEVLSERLLLLDALDMEFKTLKIKKNPDCVICGETPEIDVLIDYEEFCGIGSKKVYAYFQGNSLLTSTC